MTRYPHPRTADSAALPCAEPGADAHNLAKRRRRNRGAMLLATTLSLLAALLDTTASADTTSAQNASAVGGTSTRVATRGDAATTVGNAAADNAAADTTTATIDSVVVRMITPSDVTKKPTKKTTKKKTTRAAAPTTTAVPAKLAETTAVAPVNDTGGVWLALRKCESGNRYTINTGNGYYGAYQFSAPTWRSLGYPGLPHEAAPAVQDEAAQRLQAKAGWGQWPACARKLGLV